jgi:hypothetical protein
MKVALVFPLRLTPDRQEAWDVTSAIVPSLFPFYRVYTSDSDHSDFNRPASRNVGVDTAQKDGADVVVICDADSVPEELPLHEAIQGAFDDRLMHYPFHEAWYVDWKGMTRVKQRATADQVRSRIWDKCASEGGVWVCTPETWWQAGGQDPSLAHWGCDDRAFLAAARTLVGDPQKHQGILYCLPHTRPTDEEIWVPEEVQLMMQYQDAYQKPLLMKELIDGRSNLSSSFETASEERSPAVRVFQRDVHIRHKANHFSRSR